MRPATCHPYRPRQTKAGACKHCRDRELRRLHRERTMRRRCSCCKREFVASRPAQHRCSPACKYHQVSIAQTRARGGHVDDYLTTHDEWLAATLVRSLKERGLRLVGPRSPHRFAALRGPYYSAWRRPTSPTTFLHVVRWWSPDDAAGDLEEAA